MPAARRKPRARRSAPPSAWRGRMPAFEQRHWDLIGLALVAVSIFLSFLIYLGWDGGRGGDRLVDGLRDLVGDVHYVVPVALLAAGGVLVMRPVLSAVRPFRAAAACLFVAGCLGLEAGTLGFGPGDGRARRRAAARADLHAAGKRRVAHRRGVPVPRRRAPAHRRERGERDQGDRRLRDPRRPPRRAGRRAGPHRRHAHPHPARGARRAGGLQGERGHARAAGVLVGRRTVPGPVRGRAGGADGGGIRPRHRAVRAR